MKELFISFIIQPFYNAIILLVDFLTTDLGIVVIVFTIIIRTMLFPLSRSQIRTQIKMQEIQGPLKELQTKYKDDKEAMGREMLKLYRDNKLNPFSGIFLLLIQLPLLIGLYYVFMNTGLPNLNNNLLYSFIPRPENISTQFLGIIELTQKSLLIAILAAITQFIQMKIILLKKRPTKNTKAGEVDMEDVMHNVQKQMIYVLPVILFFAAYSFGAIIGLYILVGNIYSIGQEIYIRKTIKKQ